MNDSLNSFTFSKFKTFSSFPKKDVSEKQKCIVEQLNQRIREDGKTSYRVSSTVTLSSSMFERIVDLSKLEVRISGGFADSAGNIKSKYKSPKCMMSILFTGYEILSILKKMESLELKIDMSLSQRDRAMQIYELVCQEYSYFRPYDDALCPMGLKGILIPGNALNCVGFSQLYKELCNQANLQCEVVSGRGEINGTSKKHMWNVVLIDGDELPVDCAWHVSNGKNWFGVSDEFQQTHIPDADEKYKNYSEKTKKKMKNQIISHIVMTMDNRNGIGAGLYGIVRYWATGEINSITRCDGARDMLRNVSNHDVEVYFEQLDYDVRIDAIMNYVKDHLISKYGLIEGLKQFELFLNTKDTSYITRSDGARDVANKWLSKEDISSYSYIK